jgi:cytochrome c oxidase assembly protein subunit 15
MAIIANAVVLVHRAGEPDDAVRRPAVRESTRTVVLALMVATTISVVTGTVVTNTGPHAGDEDARRFGWDISDVARIHGTSVMITIALALALAWRVRRSPVDRPQLLGAVSSWLFVAVLQAVVGYVQYFSGVPVLLVAVHVAGATALFASTVALTLRTTVAEPVTAPGRQRIDEVV